MDLPENPTGAIFVRQQDTLVHLDAKGQAQYLGYRIKVLHPNALQLGNLSISWNPAGGNPVIHALKVHRDGEVIDVLKDARFEILRREDQLEAAHIDGILTAVLRVADLRVGDELEFSLTTRTDDPTLGSTSSGALVLHPEPGPGRYRLGLSWDDGQKPTVRMTPAFTAAQQAGKQALDFQFDNPPVVIAPKDAPPRYQVFRFAEYSDFADWNAVSRRFAKLYSETSQIGSSEPLMREVARIAKLDGGKLAKASAALKLVQQDVRYIYVGLNGGNLRPADASETWSLRYGDCKGKTVLLLGLLRELGIDAQAVMVNSSGNDDGLDERLPSPGMFDHVLVRAHIDGKTHYLDGTLPPVVPPSEKPLLPYRWVLPLTSDGSGLEHLDWHPAELPDSINIYEIDARQGFDEPARITSRTIIRGVAGLEQQVQLSAVSKAQMLSAFRQSLTGDTWQSIENVDWHYDEKAGASILEITGLGTVDWDDDGDGARSLALPGGGFNPPQRRVRTAEQDQSLPYYNKPEFSCHVTTVRLPADTRPEQWSHKRSFNQGMFGRNYYRAFAIEDGSLRMVRSYRVEEQEITAARAAKDNGRIADFDNSMGWIFYNPERDRPVVNRIDVPATFEIDWATDASACLSPNAA
ncbi:transglutaminase [Croceicoccus naphthovorans]|uniref:Transglutaminase n=2 Tax=Croceicoccus naphthovorans TaxID=1348774 RepID=A0A0G3XMA6_9SPHN|nr:transglutaminase [Croceicoccus naphthovorans]